MKHLRNILAAALTAATLGIGSVAHADIIFLLGNNPQSDEENILFNDGAGPLIEQGTTVTGATQADGLIVYFTGLEDLITPSGGQARVEAVDGAFTSLTFGVQDGTFGDFILNPNIFGTGQSQVGTIDVTVDQVVGPDAFFSYAVGPGNNYLTILAINGQRINSITVTSDAPLSFLDLRQPRISSPVLCPAGTTDPLCTGGDIPVPEPGTLLLLGLGLFAVGFARSRVHRQSA
jgi:hypothetical protein